MLPGSCAEPIPSCCEEFFDLADRLVTAAHTALIECLGEGCGELPAYVSHAEPVGPGDYIAGWISNITQVPGRASSPGAKVILPPRLLVQIQVRLVEGGYSGLAVKGGRITLPEAEQWHYAASHSYSHAQVILAAVLAAAPGACKDCHCDSYQFVSMLPGQSQAGDINWTITLNAVFDGAP